MHKLFFLSLLLFQNVNSKIDKKIQFHNDKAHKYYHSGDYSNMLYHLIEKVKLDKHDVNAYSDIAYYYWSMSINIKSRKEEFKNKAFYYLKEGIENNKDSAYMYDEMGRILTMDKNINAALPYFEEAIKRKDAPLTSFHSLAFIYFQKDKLKDAVVVLENCIKKFPDDVKGKSKLKEIKEILSQNY